MTWRAAMWIGIGIPVYLLAAWFTSLAWTAAISEPRPPPDERFTSVSGPAFSRTEVVRDNISGECFAVVAGMYGLDAYGPIPCGR